MTRKILLLFFFIKKSFFIEDESLRGRKINLIGRFEGHDDLYFQQNKLKDNFIRQRKSRKWIQHKFSEKWTKILPLPILIKESLLKFPGIDHYQSLKSNSGHIEVIQGSFWANYRHLQWGKFHSLDRRSKEIWKLFLFDIIWLFTSNIIYPYLRIFSRKTKLRFSSCQDPTVRGSWTIDARTGPWFLVKNQSKPVYSITNISMANMAEDNFPISSSFRFSSSYSFILSTFWKFIQSRDPRTISLYRWSTHWTVHWSLVKSSLSRTACMSYINGGHWMHSHGFLVQFYGSFQIILQTWTQLDYNDMDVNRSILCNFTPSKTRQSARLWDFTKISTWLWIMDFMSCYKSFLFFCPFVPE